MAPLTQGRGPGFAQKQEMESTALIKITDPASASLMFNSLLPAATPSQPRPASRLRLRRGRIALSSYVRAEEAESCHGELSCLLRATAKAQERATGARHSQECSRGAEAQAGAAHEEPGETRRGLDCPSLFPSVLVPLRARGPTSSSCKLRNSVPEPQRQSLGRSRLSWSQLPFALHLEPSQDERAVERLPFSKSFSSLTFCEQKR